jgi:hypothetical protein
MSGRQTFASLSLFIIGPSERGSFSYFAARKKQIPFAQAPDGPLSGQ